ncbi:hypothetical protein D779_1274 [Imhoffiella purpurea]|uniref:Phytochrome chromophore attachment site domain-containing protein n=2 Tax=Imhoffiella purpurea TaxID=1249627 RepID=W9VHK9_9GAMM|nr:hypothetical protein D779_1274 [Imhoffiella purpurea]
MSRNAGDLLGLGEEVLGRSLADVHGDLAERIHAHLDRPLHRVPQAIRCPAGFAGRAFDVSLHRFRRNELVIELESVAPSPDTSVQVQEMLRGIIASSSCGALCDEVARTLREISGYDRVLIYRLGVDGSGEILAADGDSHLEPAVGRREPGVAAALVSGGLSGANRVRFVGDRDAEAVRLVCAESTIGDPALDLSDCILAAPTPSCRDLLARLEARSALVMPLIVAGRHWGLILCLDSSSRYPAYAMRAVCELVAEAAATRIAALESIERAQVAFCVRSLEQRMIDSIAARGDWTPALFGDPDALLGPVSAQGVALFHDGRTITAGQVPDVQGLRDIVAWLDSLPDAPLIESHCLGGERLDFSAFAPSVCGLMAVPVSRGLGEYLIWLRSGIGGSSSERAMPWTSTDRATGTAIAESVSDVIQQFRAVRLLIAQAQLAQVRSQMEIAEQPLLVAGSDGTILLVSRFMRHLMGEAADPMRRIDDLMPLVVEPSEAGDRLRDLVERQRPWRGELCLKTRDSALSRFMVRADPVFSSPGRVLGYVLIFSDFPGRSVVEEARRRFQEGLEQRRSSIESAIGSGAEGPYRDLLCSIVGNARLAESEVVGGMDQDRIPAVVDGVNDSVARTAELLEHLVRYAGETSKLGGSSKQ